MSLSDKVLSGLSARRGTLSKSKQAELDAFLKEQRTWRKKLIHTRKTYEIRWKN